jgi:Transposase DDE domain
MHQRIVTTVRHLRQDLAGHLDKKAIHDVCRQAGHRWRDCLLTPAAIIHWFIIQVLHGNTAVEHVSLLAGRIFTGAAYCLARSNLPLRIYQAVLRALIKALIPDTHTAGLWLGRHRTFLVDGSSFSMPDTPELQAQFGQPGNQKPGCGFPVASMLVLFHAGTGLLLGALAAPLRTHEMAHIEFLHTILQLGDVLVADRGFCSFAHLALLLSRGSHAVLRMHQRQIVDFTPNRPYAGPKDKAARKGLPRSRWLRQLGVMDQLVEWFKPQQKPKWMTQEKFAALPESLILREIRYHIGRTGFRTKTVTLVTTLLDADLYTVEALADLYGVRWRVEQNLKHLKLTMKLDVLKCKTVDGVLKELAIFAIVYNLVRIVMMEAAARQGVDIERISFIDALRWLCEMKKDSLPKLVVNPARPGRFEPRVRKRRPKEYPLMKRPRSELRKCLLEQQVAA